MCSDFSKRFFMVEIDYVEPSHANRHAFLLTLVRIVNSHPDFNNILNGNASLRLADIRNEVNEVLNMGGTKRTNSAL